ncbi:Fanconi anemia group E protein [Sardina pilchardus]|uniref:Fanconi anemia group E protein n=1 Tax=Sardina pilchardus TaxID=27697 RepID=UPI002E15AA5C
MEPKELMQRFDTRSRLLLGALILGSAGVSKALKVFNRQRISDTDFPLRKILVRLCEEEPCLDRESQALTSKPLVCLFPASFKWSLLSFLHLVHTILPKDCILSLTGCLSREENAAPWTASLVGQLHRDIRDGGSREILTPQCKTSVRELCVQFKGTGRSGGWSSYFAKTKICETDTVPSSQSQKRKSGELDVDSSHEGQQSKRMKMELPTSGGGGGGGVGLLEEAAEEMEASPSKESPQDQTPVDDAVASLLPPPDSSCVILPDHIKAAVPVIKELLETEMEWDQSTVAALGVLNECDPIQVDMLCGLLQLDEVPEQPLAQFCSCLLALSPDLSHSVAAALIRNLLLNKVISLSEPASRWLSSAVSSVCARYPRPMCQELIKPILEGDQTGTVQVELICRLIEDSLEPQYRLLVFGMTLSGSWNESILSVIHCLLETRLELTDECFTRFTNHLGSQSPSFVKSMKFAKMLLTVLTKYQSHIKGGCRHTLSCCLDANGTFLKKSLQAALKRISH